MIIRQSKRLESRPVLTECTRFQQMCPSARLNIFIINFGQRCILVREPISPSSNTDVSRVVATAASSVGPGSRN